MKPSLPLITLENIKIFRGRVKVLDLPTFSLNQREMISLIGPNGSGKSTLLLTLNGLLKPAAGKILFKGRVLDSNQALLESRRRMAMVFQEPLLFDTTVFNNVASGLKIRGIKKEKIRTRVMEYLERFNIGHLAGRSARKLSGGEAQRTSLARALATEPEVLFLDEPFSALDPPTRQSIITDLERIIRETGLAAVLVTHDETEAIRLSDRILVLNRGEIVQTGEPREIMNRPVNRFVAEFVGMENVIPGQVLGKSQGRVSISIPGGIIRTSAADIPGEKVYCGIRPEKIQVWKGESPAAIADENVFQGRVTAVSSNGPFLKVFLDCGLPLSAYMSREILAEEKIKTGDTYSIAFRPEDIHLMPGEDEIS
ncbi:MAG: ABC transporter ATP-binding protein [Thermodesulfobacteriota bacterium]